MEEDEIPSLSLSLSAGCVLTYRKGCWPQPAFFFWRALWYIVARTSRGVSKKKSSSLFPGGISEAIKMHSWWGGSGNLGRF